MFTFDQSQIGSYHVQDLRHQARRDADASVVARSAAPRGGLRRRLRTARASL